MPDACIDSVATDPPYGLSKQPDMAEVLRQWLAGHDYEHTGKGFMGKTWDSFVPGPAIWREVFRVLKPGGHVLSFFGTRTYDLGVTAMRLAGFEIRDQLAWMTGTGVPKSLDYAADPVESKRQGRRVLKPAFVGHPQEEGFGTSIKPAFEPIVLARKPLAGTVAANVLEYGTGGINVDGCRIATAERWAGRQTDSGPSVALRGGADGSLNNQSSGSHDLGRFPANVILDEHAAAMLDAQTGSLKGGTAVRRNNTQGGETSYSKAHAPGTPDLGYGDSGGASRFFYCAKTSKREREAGLEHLRKRDASELLGRQEGSAGLDSPRAGAGRGGGRANTHPTVKPIALMQWLVRLITPPGGIVLDPFAGSGSTGCAAVREGFRFLGIEMQPEYVEIARARLVAAGK
jgi:site-specific DNA-methyltransferase (adenine-specific)